MKTNKIKNDKNGWKLFSAFAAALLLSTATPAEFNYIDDILIAQYDGCPDADDLMSQAAFGCMLKHPDLAGVNVYGVMNAYGTQIAEHTPIWNSTELMEMVFDGPEGDDTWTNADRPEGNGTGDWEGSVTRIVNKVKPYLDAGGDVWVMEAGQSDMTADWVKELIRQGVTLATTKSRIHVVQHSGWNESVTTAADLAYVQENTDYVKVADGNQNNDTPKYKNTLHTYILEATDPGNPNTAARNMWQKAEEIIGDWSDPAYSIINDSNQDGTLDIGGVDFSDTVEAWWILNLGTQADITRGFWNRYVVNTPANTAPTVSFVLPETDLDGVPPGTTLSIQANASDPDGNLESVELLRNDVSVRTIPAGSPYQWGAGDSLLEDLSAGTYEFTLIAQDSAGLTDTAYRTVTVSDLDLTAPTPNRLSWISTTATETTITVTAETAEDPSGVYYTFNWRKGTDPWTSSGLVTDPTFTATNLVADSEYTLYVIAQDGVMPEPNRGSWSLPIKVSTLPADGGVLTPATASFASVIPLSSTAITVTANEPTQATGIVQYRFWCKQTGVFSPWLTESTYTFNGMTPSTSYEFKAYMQDDNTTTPWSGLSAAVMTPVASGALTPTTAAVDSVVVVNPTTIEVTVAQPTQSTGAVEYRFWNSVTKEYSAWQTSKIWSNTGLSSGTTYRFKAVMRDENTQSAWSALSEPVTP